MWMSAQACVCRCLCANVYKRAREKGLWVMGRDWLNHWPGCIRAPQNILYWGTTAYVSTLTQWPATHFTLWQMHCVAKVWYYLKGSFEKSLSVSSSYLECNITLLLKANKSLKDLLCNRTLNSDPIILRHLSISYYFTSASQAHRMRDVSISCLSFPGLCATCMVISVWLTRSVICHCPPLRGSHRLTT